MHYKMCNIFQMYQIYSQSNGGVFMIDTAKKIFSRVYQSYLMGGDMYTYYYKANNENELHNILEALKELEENGLIDIIHLGNKKARMCITSEGITYGSNNY